MSKSGKINYRHNERGSAGAKFLVVMAVIILIAHAGFNFVPVAYQAETVKQEMHTAILQGLSLPSNRNPADIIKNRLSQVAVNEQLPPAYIDVKQVNNVLTARVAYTQDVSILPFGIYTYHYYFDHTATPTGFLMKQ